MQKYLLICSSEMWMILNILRNKINYVEIDFLVLYEEKGYEFNSQRKI